MSPVVSVLTTLFSLSDTLAWQFQKLNIKFCYFSLNLNQDPYVEDVPEVKGFPTGYEKDSYQWLQFSLRVTNKPPENLLCWSAVQTKCGGCFFPLLFMLST